MPKVVFVQPDGSREMHEAPCGHSVMDCAVDNGVAGIAAQCGGGCTCSTCHAVLAEPWFSELGPPVGDEADILEFVPERRAASRLTCQITLTPELDGIVVQVVEEEPAACRLSEEGEDALLGPG